MSRKVIYLIILLLVFAAGGSCSRYHQAGYHGPNRVRAIPHKEWKQPKSRYKKAMKEDGMRYAACGTRLYVEDLRLRGSF